MCVIGLGDPRGGGAACDSLPAARKKCLGVYKFLRFFVRIVLYFAGCFRPFSCTSGGFFPAVGYILMVFLGFSYSAALFF
jgi:hypothetical protein